MEQHVNTTGNGTGFKRRVGGSVLRVQIWRYGVVGVVNTLIGYALIVTLHMAIGLSLLSANVLGYAAGLSFSYFANRRWTFGHRGPAAHSLPAFLALVALGFIANLAATSVSQRLGLPYPVAQALGFACYSTIVFVGLRNVFSLHA